MASPGEQSPSTIGGIRRADVLSASALVGLLLLYGCLMAAISHVELGRLAVHVSNFAGLSFYSAILASCGYAALCLLNSAARRNADRRFFWLAVAGVITTLTFPFFAMFKELVLPTRGFLWDSSFAHFGRLLFGTSPWLLAHDEFGSVAGARVLDLAYRFWLPFMFGLPLISAVFLDDDRLRLRIIATWTVSWIAIGTIGGWYFASAGPCFFNTFISHDADYANLLRRLADLQQQASRQGHSIESLQYQSRLLETYRAHDYAPGGGISAMPSMHVAMASLVAMVAFRIDWRLGIPFAAFEVTVWLSTVFFGWHYFVDGPVGALMMFAIWSLAKRVAARVYPGSTAGRSIDIALDDAELLVA